MLKVYKIHEQLIKMVIIFLPIMGTIMNGKGPLKTLGGDASFYPLILGVSLWLIIFIRNREKISLPKANSFFYMLMIAICIIISNAINFTNIYDAYHQGENGLQRMIMQLGTYVFLLISLIYLYNFFLKKNNVWSFINKWLLVSVVFTSIYSMFEIGGNFLKIDFCNAVIEGIDVILRDGGSGEGMIRLRSLAMEPSYFAMYAMTVYPWLIYKSIFAYCGKFKYIPLFIFFSSMMLLTLSRTLYPIMFLELVMFFLMSHRFSKRVVVGGLLITGGMILCCVVGVYDNFIDLNFLSVINSIFIVEGMSNITRYGSQLAAFNMFKDFPIFGVGWGQFGFYAAEYYPIWAWNSLEIQEYGISGWGTLPPPYSIYARFLSELGMMGGLMLVGVFYYLIKESICLYKKSDLNDKPYSICIFISIFAYIISGVSGDNMYRWSSWIIITALWALNDKEGKNNNEG